MRVISLLTVLLLSTAAFAGITPLLDPRAGSIVDLGYTDVNDIPNTVPKIWSQYPSDYELLTEAFTGKVRELSDSTQCIADSSGIENCPLESEQCPNVVSYNSGSSLKLTGTRLDAPYCDYGTLDVSTGLCVEDSICPTGYTRTSTGYCTLSYSHSMGQTVYAPVYVSRFQKGEAYLVLEYPDDYTMKLYIQNYEPGGTSLTPRRTLMGTMSSAGEVPIRYFSVSAGWTINIGTSYSVPWSNVMHIGTGLYARIDFVKLTYSSTRTPVCSAGTGMVLNYADKTQCYKSSVCNDPYVKVNNTCQQTYFYYKYSCDTANGWAGPLLESGADCNGACGANNCECNAAIAPDQNCRSEAIGSCPSDPSRACTIIAAAGSEGSSSTQSVPMVTHMVGGNEFLPDEYGAFRAAGCADDCVFAIDKIIGEGSSICIENGAGVKECATVDGCSFSGAIEASTLNHLSYLTVDPVAKTIAGYEGRNETSVGTITSTCGINGGVGYTGRWDQIMATKHEGDKIKFWNSFNQEGYLGFLEFIREVDAASLADGYKPEHEISWTLQDIGFSKVEEFLGRTYAVFKTPIPLAECQNAAAAVGYTLVPDMESTRGKGDAYYDYIFSLSANNYNTNPDVPFYDQAGTCYEGYTYDAVSDMCKATMYVTDRVCKIAHYDDCYANDTLRVTIPDAGNTATYQHKISNSEMIYTINEECKFVNVPTKVASGCGNFENGWKFLSDRNYIFDQTSSGWSPWYLIYDEIPIQTDDYKEVQCPADTISRDGMVCHRPIGSATRCIIESFAQDEFKASDFAIKTLENNSTVAQAFCSPISCVNHACQTASCPAGYDGGIVPTGFTPPTRADCIAQVCDANTAYYDSCGAAQECPTEIPGVYLLQTDPITYYLDRTEVIEYGTEECRKIVCPEGGFNAEDLKCYKWQCPTGYTDTGVECAPN